MTRRRPHRFRRRFTSWAIHMGLASGGMYAWDGGQPVTAIYWRGKRCSILGWTPAEWRCLLKFHHWPGPRVGFSMCGKCVPWQCCGSTTWGHRPDCDEDRRREFYGDDEAEWPTPERPYF